MATVTMRDLLEAGVHFGHQTRRWNPKMDRFLYGARNGIHIIDLGKTVKALGEALAAVRETAASGDQILFVGTKRQARTIIETEATRCNMPFVTTRWLGGTLTNFTTIHERINKFIELSEEVDSIAANLEENTDLISTEAGGEGQEDAQRKSSSGLTKRELVGKQKNFERMQRFYSGMQNMERTPGLVFIVDPTLDEIAVKEANRSGIKVVALCDSNSNPDNIDFPIPSNDDALRAIQLITSSVADSIIEGVAVGEIEQEYDADLAASAHTAADETTDQESTEAS
ncbi:MAG: 30S ribosomal protein S2 [Chloroflexota bacterium]|nr:30S ribosomal protein S2 [Chloroflexota bacterium]